MFGIVSVYTNMQAGVSASVRVYVVNTGSCAGHGFFMALRSHDLY